MKHFSDAADWLHDLVTRGWPGVALWFGSWSLKDVSDLLSVISGLLGCVWFLMQMHYARKRNSKR